MNLVKHTEGDAQVLKWVDALGMMQRIYQRDTAEYDAAIADPANTVVDYVNTAEYAEEVAANKVDEELRWRDFNLENQNAIVADLEDRGAPQGEINSAKALRVSLRDYPQEVDFPNGIRPITIAVD